MAKETVDNAWPVMEKIGLHPDASLDRLHIVDSLETMTASADFIQESAPERLELKTELHRRIDQVTDPAVVIASSTSGLLPSEFQSRCRHPERILVGHPFNPVYLLPLVEVVAGERTFEETVDRAMRIYADLGMHPLRVRKKVPGFLPTGYRKRYGEKHCIWSRRYRNSRRAGCGDFLWAWN